MSNKGNLKLIKARYEAVNSHDFEKFQSFYDKSISWEDPHLERAVKGPAAVRRRLESLTGAFPDLKWELGRIFTEGENVCAEFTFTGTHRGKLDNRGRAISASNQRIRIPAVGVYTVRGNKIVDSKIYYSFEDLKKQPGKAKAAARKTPRKRKS